jgi:hypothetical protein
MALSGTIRLMSARVLSSAGPVLPSFVVDSVIYALQNFETTVKLCTQTSAIPEATNGSPSTTAVGAISAADVVAVPVESNVLASFFAWRDFPNGVKSSPNSRRHSALFRENRQSGKY